MSYGAIIVGGGTLAYGAIKEGEAKKRARQLANTRPKETPSPELGQVESLAASELSNDRNPAVNGQGSPDQDRALSSSLEAIMKGGGDPNSISSIFSADQVGRQRMALMREGIRLQKVNNYVSSLKDRSDERQQEFGFNEYAPWADQTQANAQEKQYGTNLEFQGLNTVGSGVAGYLSNKQTQGMLDKYFKPSSQPSGTSVNTNALPSSQTSNGSNLTPESDTWNTPKFTPIQTGSNNDAIDYSQPTYE